MSLWLPKCWACANPLHDRLRYVGPAPPHALFRGELIAGCARCGADNRLGPATEWVEVDVSAEPPEA